MNITKSKLEALKYYLSFNAPVLVGEPDFSEWNSDIGAYVTVIDGIDYTSSEYRKLKQGAEVYEYLQDQLEEVDFQLAFVKTLL